jgi:hypothetical protein
LIDRFCDLFLARNKSGSVVFNFRAAVLSFVGVLSLSAVPAQAVNFTFDLNGTGTAGGGTSYGNYRTYTLTSGTGKNKITVNMRVSAWSWDGTKITNAFLGNNTASNGGLYDINRSEGNGDNNTHTIDNQKGVDFLLFQFDRNVQLTGVTANAFSLAGSVDNDLTVGRSVSVTNSWNSAPTGWNGLSVNDMADLFQAQKNIDSSTTGNTLDANRVLNPAGSSVITGKVWMISASLANSDHKIDGFKLDTLKINTAANMPLLGPVPEPANWAMMIGGFGMIGAVTRRRRAAPRLAVN